MIDLKDRMEKALTKFGNEKSYDETKTTEPMRRAKYFDEKSGDKEINEIVKKYEKE
jgi:hypothetical protein